MKDLILYVGKLSVRDGPDSLWALVGCVRDKTSVCFVIVNTSCSDGCMFSVCGVICHCRVGEVTVLFLLTCELKGKRKVNFLFQPE